MSDRLNRRITGGFTLVELQVVIAVLGVLIALLLPALGRAKEEARRTVCRQHERQILMAELMYAQVPELSTFALCATALLLLIVCPERWR